MFCSVLNISVQIINKNVFQNKFVNFTKFGKHPVILINWFVHIESISQKIKNLTIKFRHPGQNILGGTNLSISTNILIFKNDTPHNKHQCMINEPPALNTKYDQKNVSYVVYPLIYYIFTNSKYEILLSSLPIFFVDEKKSFIITLVKNIYIKKQQILTRENAWFTPFYLKQVVGKVVKVSVSEKTIIQLCKKDQQKGIN